MKTKTNMAFFIKLLKTKILYAITITSVFISCNSYPNQTMEEKMKHKISKFKKMQKCTIVKADPSGGSNVYNFYVVVDNQDSIHICEYDHFRGRFIEVNQDQKAKN